MQINIIKCHGSGNEFVMVDLVAAAEGENAAAESESPTEAVAAEKNILSEEDLPVFAREVCADARMEGADGVLYVVREGDRYAMRMFNPDGSEAEMCGNGIRCVARLVEERYERDGSFTLGSGGGSYPINRGEVMGGSIATYGVDIAVRCSSPDFGFMAEGQDRFVGEVIPALDENLRFTALNLGNPHIVASVESIDMALLERLGERVKELKTKFPRGINVSLYEKRGERAIFVATYERGAGITYSCGTAMTASSTASVLLGISPEGEQIEVYNRGGMVRCRCRIADEKIVTRLTGNATYRWAATVEWDGCSVQQFRKTEIYDREVEAYDTFVSRIR